MKNHGDKQPQNGLGQAVKNESLVRPTGTKKMRNEKRGKRKEAKKKERMPISPPQWSRAQGNCSNSLYRF